MESDQVFTAAGLYCRRPHGNVSIAWSDSDRISVTIRLDLRLDPSGFDKTWHLTPGDSRQMQSLLGALVEGSAQIGDDCILDLGRPGGMSIRHSWSLATETHLLRQVRQGFDNLAHLHYTEAIAALELGHNLSAMDRQRDAIAAFRLGIEALGDRYVGPNLIDDTNAKFILAEHSLRINKMAQAAALFERVLESRTQAYQRRFNPK